MASMFERFKKKRRINSLRKFIIKTKRTSKSGFITLDEFEKIIQYWKRSNVNGYDDYKSTLLANLLKEVYSDKIDIALINILDHLIADVTEIVNGPDDDNYSNHDSYIIKIIRMLGVIGTPLAEAKILMLLLGSYERKVWQIVDDGLYHAVDNLSSEPAIDAFIQFVKTDHPRNTYVKNSIISRLQILQSVEANPVIFEKLRKINHDLDIERERLKKANEEFERALMEKQRIAEFKRREEESQKWWHEHPDQERDPSRMDR